MQVFVVIQQDGIV